MKVHVLSVGKPRDPELTRLHDRYAERLARLGADYRCRFVPEVRPGGRFSDDHVREREARSLREGLDGRGTVVALDATGQQLASPRMAERLERWATPRVTFVIGGPLGLERAFVEEADWAWSLSSLTFPHELVRVVLAEQLYRALTILKGVPYHK